MKNLCVFLACLFIFMSAVPGSIPAFAAGTPTVTVSQSTVAPGSGVYLYITASDFTNVAAAEIDIYYDSTAFTVSGVSVSTGDISSYNADNPGTVKISIGSIAGISGNVQLARIYFSVKTDAPAASYPIRVTVGDVYNTDRGQVAVAGVDGKIEIQQTSYVPEIDIYSTVPSGSYMHGDEVTVTFYSYSLSGLCGGNFEITYDSAILEYQSLSLLDGMKTGQQITSISDSNPGRTVLSYVSPTACKTGDLFAVKFKVKADTDALTRIKLSTSELVNDSRQSMICDGTYADITTEKKPVTVVLPKIWISAPQSLSVYQTAQVSLWVEGGSNLAAGDFTLSYDQTKLEIISEPTGGENLGNIGASVITNPNYSQGTVKFSFICSDGITEDTQLLTFTVKAKENSTYTSNISCIGKALKNSNFKDVAVEYKSAAVEVQAVEGPIQNPKLTFRSATLTLYNNISVNYNVSKSVVSQLGLSEPFVKFNFMGSERQCTTYKESDEYYIFEFADVYSYMMDETITATVYAKDQYGNTNCGTTVNYSVATYCYNRIEKSTSAEMKTLAVDILNYGAAAQVYFKYNTDDLVNARLTPEQKLLASADRQLENITDVFYKAIEAPSVTWRSAALVLKNAVAVRYTFNAESVEGLTLKITDENGKVWLMSGSDFKTDEDGIKYVDFAGLNATYFSTAIYAVFLKNGAEVSNTLSYSVESYAQSKQNSTTLGLADLVKSIMRYGDSATAYFESLAG